MYKTCTNKLQFIDDQPAANSLLALAEDADQAQYDADLGNQWDAACTVADGELAAAEANALEQMAAETTAPADAVEIIDPRRRFSSARTARICAYRRRVLQPRSR